jgi:ABC-type nickel/cobalt efflux system permease component RcnA
VLRTQQSLQHDLAAGVKNLKGEHVMAAAGMLVLASFIYGVVHAVGPGHGKMVISSYVVANEQTVRRGVVISFIAAALQALTAIALAASSLRQCLRPSDHAWSNQLEHELCAIALVGAWLLTTQLVRLTVAGRRTIQHAGHGHHHDHGHHHHDHAEGEACSHMVDARELAGPLDWRKILAVVFSVGIRPCTGAILVLIFALTQGMFWAGVAATFAMAFGTAITVAVLATLALGSRELALKPGGKTGALPCRMDVCAIGGSALIPFGATLFAASPDRRGCSERGEPSSASPAIGVAGLIALSMARRAPDLVLLLPVSRPENSVSICRAGLHGEQDILIFREFLRAQARCRPFLASISGDNTYQLRYRPGL